MHLLQDCMQFIIYGICSKISNDFLTLFSNKMMDIRAGILKMLVRIANRENPDQTSLEAVWVCIGLFGSQLVIHIVEHLSHI